MTAICWVPEGCPQRGHPAFFVINNLAQMGRLTMQICRFTQSAVTEYFKATGAGWMPLPVALLLACVEVTGGHCLFPSRMD